MSFGFGVGDFINVLQLAKKMCKEFSDAPSQYQAITIECQSTTQILEEIQDIRQRNGLSTAQQAKLDGIVRDIGKVLNDTQDAISKSSSLESRQAGFRGRARRIWDRVRFEPDDIRDLRQRIAAHLILLNTFVTGLGTVRVARLISAQEQQEIRTILDWLTPCDYTSQHANHLARRLPGTGQWVLDSPEFQTWLNDDDCKGICLQGIPGIGKTILTATVIEYLHNRFGHDNKIGIGYYYCDYKRQENKSDKVDFQQDHQNLYHILLRLLRQLAESCLTILPDLRSIYEKHHRSGTIPTLEEVRMLYYLYVKSLSRTYIILDALDECQLIDGCRRSILSELQDMCNMHNIHVVVTSRPLPDIKNTLHSFKTNEIRASKEDISRYVEASITKMPNFVIRDSGLQEEIKNAIVASADGIFLLAALYAQSLQGKRSPGATRKALRAFGQGAAAYTEAYDKTMERITSQIEDLKVLAIETLMWVVYAQRSLKSPELLHALATDVYEMTLDHEDIPDIEDVLAACCGLVIIEQDSQVVRLVHRTAQEFFLNSACKWLDGSHTKLSRICIHYLSHNSLPKDSTSNEFYQESLTRYPLWEYASWYWQHHTERREDPMLLEELAAKQKQLDISSQALIRRMVPEYFEKCRAHPGITGLHLLALCGLDAYIPSFSRHHDIDAKDQHGQSPISYALQQARESTVIALVAAGTNVNGLYNFPRVDSIIRDGLGRRVKSLSIPSTSEYSTTLLIWSVRFHPDLVPLLVSGGAYLDAVDTLGRNVLHWAVLCSETQLALYFIEKGLDMCLTTHEGLMPIHFALITGKLGIVELLLTKRIAISPSQYATQFSSQLLNLEQINKGFLLRKALLGGKLYTTSWLLHNDVDPNDMSFNDPPLVYAARTGIEDMVMVLLSHGADIDLVDNNGRTALVEATRMKMTEMVALLIENGADVDTSSSHDSTALLFAIKDAYEDIVSLLLANNANPNVCNSHGLTALMYAVGCGSDPSIAGLLLKNGARVDDVDRDGRSALAWTIKSPSRHHINDFVSLLLHYGANAEIRCKQKSTLLDDATRYGHQAIVKILIEKFYQKDCSVNSEDGPHARRFPWSSLHWAYRAQRWDIVKLLIKLGVHSYGFSMTDSRIIWRPLNVMYMGNSEEDIGDPVITLPQSMYRSPLDPAVIEARRTNVLLHKQNVHSKERMCDICDPTCKVYDTFVDWYSHLCVQCEWRIWIEQARLELPVS